MVNFDSDVMVIAKDKLNDSLLSIASAISLSSSLNVPSFPMSRLVTDLPGNLTIIKSKISDDIEWANKAISIFENNNDSSIKAINSVAESGSIFKEMTINKI